MTTFMELLRKGILIEPEKFLDAERCWWLLADNERPPGLIHEYLGMNVAQYFKYRENTVKFIEEYNGTL